MPRFFAMSGRTRGWLSESGQKFSFETYSVRQVGLEDAVPTVAA